PIASLDIIRLRDIFSGKIVNWRDLEVDLPAIAALARAPGSGTELLFSERVMVDTAYGADVHKLPTNEAIVAEVGRQPGAIGYTGLGALRSGGDRIKVIALRTVADSQPVSPTTETIHDASYPLARTLLLVTAGSPSGTAKAFLEFCQGPSGR